MIFWNAASEMREETQPLKSTRDTLDLIAARFRRLEQRVARLESRERTTYIYC